ncbi:Nnf1-domain-containing protein [Lineolata rhizophorae]|uniref:Nnf1-domain-containing protein n=1 Tax=Lineolata rhizophorae TaxID=578093 RepID=A0A6A6PBB3_9PEZI|nr:Nnf1-domain-containing protein [Lineolata rhizophorae]
MATDDGAPTAPHAAAPSRSPTPPPPQHQTQGPRATALHNAFHGALSATLKRCGYGSFAACFPTAAERAPEALEAFWRSFVGRLEEVCAGQFAELVAERGVVEGLNGLDGLVEGARRRRKEVEEARGMGEGLAKQGGEGGTPIIPHTLPPATLAAAHLAPFLAAQQATLSTRLGSVQQSNADLFATVKAQRAELEDLVAGLEKVVGDLEGGVKMLSEGGDGKGGGVEGLGDEVWGVEKDLAEAAAKRE